MMRQYSFLRTALIAGIAIGGAGTAMAQQSPPKDPVKVSVFKGTVAQYALTPRGDVSGLILADGAEIFAPARLSTQLVFSVHPGDAVTISGSKVGVTPIVVAASITNDATHNVVADIGPPGPPKLVEDQGRVKNQLFNRQGALDGVLLEDGTMVRMPPPEAERLAANLAVGQPIFVRGDGVTSVLGKVIAAHGIGPDNTHVATIGASFFQRWKQDLFGSKDGDAPSPVASPKT